MAVNFRELINVIEAHEDDVDSLRIVAILTYDDVSTIRNKLSIIRSEYDKNPTSKNRDSLVDALEISIQYIDSITHGKFWEQYHEHPAYEEVSELYLKLEDEIYEEYSKIK